MISIEHEFDHLFKDLNSIEKQALPKALRQAQNKVLSSVRVHAQRTISKETGIKQRSVKDKLVERPATQARKVAELDAKPGKAYNLIASVTPSQRKPGYFNQRMKSGKRKGQYRAKGVVARAWGKRKVYRGSFIVDTRKGPLVMKRGLSKLEPLAGPSVRHTFIKKEFISSMRAKVRERLPLELERSLRREAGKIRRSIYG